MAEKLSDVEKRNKFVVKMWLQRAVNGRDHEFEKECCAPEFTNRSDPSFLQQEMGTGPEAHGAGVQWFAEQFPDFTSGTQLLIAEGDRVAVLTRATGTHEKGEWLGAKAHGEEIDFLSIDILTLKNGKIIDHDAVCEMSKMLSQLGVPDDRTTEDRGPSGRP
jgi:hypothetical protein